MKELIEFLSSLETGSFVVIFGLILSIVFITTMSVVLAKSLKGMDVSRLMVDPITQQLSQHKFWTNVAFFIGSVAFIKFNFNNVDSPYLVEIWAIYLTVIGGVDVFSSWMKQKTRSKELEHGYREGSHYNRYDDYEYRQYESYVDRNSSGGSVSGKREETEEEALERFKNLNNPEG